MEEKVKTVLIASGGGTDAFAIMDAYSKGYLPNVSIEALISTKEGAGCLEKAEKFGIKTIVIDRKKLGHIEFNRALNSKLRRLECQLVFLVGCVVHIWPENFYAMYNIHPADIFKFGGKGMYGLKVHERVLENVVDLIARGKGDVRDNIFYTYPTVHVVTKDYDSGDPLMTVAVQIPFDLLYTLIGYRTINLKEAAKRLQEHVLQYEWTMLPTAVNIAALKILNG